MDPIELLVISNPAARHLRLLDQLPEPVNIQVGDDSEFLQSHAAKADVILTGGLSDRLLRAAFMHAPNVRWVHVLWAGVDKLLFPELIASTVPLTNGRGVFKDGLAEFTLASIFHFAKDFRALIRNQEQAAWKQFDNVEVRGQVLGVVGYGAIGREAARLARAVGMKVLAVRRRSALAAEDPLVDRVYAPDQLHEMLALSDYVMVAAPLTRETRGMIGETELKCLKKSAVVINVGRGPVIVEQALIAALEQGSIKGAALDVFDTEPLPAGHPFYRLSNVLLSPHAADHIEGWAERAVHRFLENFARFREGQPLENIVDKKAGY